MVSFVKQSFESLFAKTALVDRTLKMGLLMHFPLSVVVKKSFAQGTGVLFRMEM